MKTRVLVDDMPRRRPKENMLEVTRELIRDTKRLSSFEKRRFREELLEIGKNEKEDDCAQIQIIFHSILDMEADYKDERKTASYRFFAWAVIIGALIIGAAIVDDSE